MATKEQQKYRDTVPTDKRIALALEGLNDTFVRALAILEALTAPVLADMERRKARDLADEAAEKARAAALGAPPAGS